MSDEAVQQEVCARFAAPYLPAPPNRTVALSKDFDLSVLPLSGHRQPPAAGSTGWYLWTGTEPSPDPDDYLPVGVEHLSELCPEALPYLGLGVGWRFLLAPRHEDAWEEG